MEQVLLFVFGGEKTLQIIYRTAFWIVLYSLMFTGTVVLLYSYD